MERRREIAMTWDWVGFFGAFGLSDRHHMEDMVFSCVAS